MHQIKWKLILPYNKMLKMGTFSPNKSHSEISIWRGYLGASENVLDTWRNVGQRPITKKTSHR